MRSGSAATSFSSTFDSDLQKFETDAGFLAYDTVPALETAVAFFDPVLANPDDSDATRRLLNDFLEAHPRCCFLHCGPQFTAALADAGLLINPYGVENRVALPLSLKGTRMRGLRREVSAAQALGVQVEAIADDVEATSDLWRELLEVNERWIKSRVAPVEVKRATRRAKAGPEKHTTKFVARAPSGEAVGWACFDHIYESGQLVGVGLSVLRSDPRYPGVSTMLAFEGATACADRYRPSLRFLDLGLSPLAPVPDGMDWNPLAVCGLAEECVVEPARARFVDVLFASLFRWGTRLYNTPGLAGWKRKWRPTEGVAYVGVQNGYPVRELVAVLLLLVF